MANVYSLTRAQRVVSQGKDKPALINHKTKSLVMILRKNHLDYARVNVIVPKKYVGLAVNRNRIKRWVKEQFRLRQSSLKGTDLVVISRFLNKQLDFHLCGKAFDGLIKDYQQSA